MYISRVQLTDIRCIHEITLDLESPTRTNKSLLLLGDNGVGKSTILRAIAIGLCDRAGAAGLLSDMYGDLISDGATAGAITIALKDGKKEYRIDTTITRSDAGLEELTKETTPQPFPWDKMFVSGYGANRGMQGNKTYEQYSIADAVYTLFNYDWPLQNPELVIRRRIRKAQGAEERKICDQLAEILMLKSGDVSLTDNGLTVRTNGGRAVHVGSLADGHESTLTWILDLVGWTYLARPRTRRAEPSGIVLIDELEQHLHPRWQRHILRLLTDQFPRVQFIVTTHSALCAAGTADLKQDRCVVKVFVRDEDGVVRDEDVAPMAGWRYDQILTSAAFGLPLARDVTTEKLVEELRLEYPLPGKEESAEFHKALAKLRTRSVRTAEDERQRQTEERLANELEEIRKLLGGSQ